MKDNVTRGKSSGEGVNDNVASIIIKLYTMDRKITKTGQSIDAIQVGCNNCSIPLLTKDCDLDENGNKKCKYLTRVVIGLMKI